MSQLVWCLNTLWHSRHKITDVNRRAWPFFSKKYLVVVMLFTKNVLQTAKKSLERRWDLFLASRFDRIPKVTTRCFKSMQKTAVEFFFYVGRAFVILVHLSVMTKINWLPSSDLVGSSNMSIQTYSRGVSEKTFQPLVDFSCARLCAHEWSSQNLA